MVTIWLIALLHPFRRAPGGKETIVVRPASLAELIMGFSEPEHYLHRETVVAELPRCGSKHRNQTTRGRIVENVMADFADQFDVLTMQALHP
jgi:hypothetical protein